MNYGKSNTHPALLYMLENGICYDEILEPILLASCFELEMTQGSPSWSVKTYLTRSVVSHLNIELIEIMWDDVGCYFNVRKHHPKMLQILGAVLRSIAEINSHS